MKATIRIGIDPASSSVTVVYDAAKAVEDTAFLNKAYPELKVKAMPYAVAYHAPEMVDALRAILFQVIQGKILERDACIRLAREALSKAECLTSDDWRVVAGLRKPLGSI